jgi:Tfp pilus assembly protein PilO
MKIPKLFSLAQMSRRERAMLMIGVLVVAGFGLWGLAKIPVWYLDQMKTLDRLIQQKRQDRLTLAQLRQEYAGLRQQINAVESRIAKDRGFSLLSHLETLATNQAVRPNIAYMRPQPPTDVDRYREVGVEIKVDNVTLEQIVRLLSSLETSPYLIKVKNLRLRTRFADPRFLDVTFLATTYEEK